MVEIPEHLRKRAEEARKKAEAAKGGGDEASSAGSSDAGAAEPSAAASRIPAHLLERSKSARQQSDSAAAAPAAPAGGGVATAAPPPAQAGVPPVGAGPDGNTHRLLTVVKSGSIQDVKASPQDKVHVWPHLLAIEFVAALACTVLLLVTSVFINAPLEEMANLNNTPNPAKAPWYFLGLQELLTLFHPMVAGVTIPTIALVLLIFAPYIDRNPSIKPENRKFVISLFTIFMMMWSVLVLVSSFFRGEGYNFTFPWGEGGIHFEL
jgi:hypothetical protein